MAGLVPAIHVFLPQKIKQGVDARHKAGHDEGESFNPCEQSEAIRVRTTPIANQQVSFPRRR
jgi:hypothetical protein